MVMHFRSYLYLISTLASARVLSGCVEKLETVKRFTVARTLAAPGRSRGANEKVEYLRLHRHREPTVTFSPGSPIIFKFYGLLSQPGGSLFGARVRECFLFSSLFHRPTTLGANTDDAQ